MQCLIEANFRPMAVRFPALLRGISGFPLRQWHRTRSMLHTVLAFALHVHEYLQLLV